MIRKAVNTHTLPPYSMEPPNHATSRHRQGGKGRRMPVQPGSADGLVPVACAAELEGADGIAVRDGRMYLAVTRQDRVVEIDPSGGASTVAEGDDLAAPAGLALVSEDLYVTAFGLPAGRPTLLRVGVS